MPRPPILEPIDFAPVFNGGKTYAEWLAIAENPANAQKMEDHRKALRLEPAHAAHLKGIARVVHVIAIAEDWCGDVHLHVPVLELISAAAPSVKVRYIARADHPEVFKRFLTNGGEAIPKFVFLNDTFTECGNWGPMPDASRRIIARGKGAGNVGAARKRVSALYEADPNREHAIGELIALIDIATCTTP